MPELKKRKQIRLPNYDYSENGFYFVTVCSNDRQNIFGRIEDGQTILNDAGTMIDFWWSQIPLHFSCVELDQHIVMPNHIHAIINIVGADRCVRPIHNNTVRQNSDIDTPNHTDSTKNDLVHFQNNGRTHRSAPTVSEMMQWFKTMTTNDYIKNVKTNNWPAFNKHVWQRSFYDHVIRNERSLNAIREYILDNPVNWQQDIENLLKL